MPSFRSFSSPTSHTHNLHYNYERPTIQRICLWTWPPDTNDAPNAQAHAPSLFWCHEFRRLKRQKAHQATELQKQCRCLVCVLPHLRDRHGSCSVLDHYPRSQCPCPPLLSPSWKILFLCLSFSPLPPISLSLWPSPLRTHMSLHSTVCDCRKYIWNVLERCWNILERWHVKGQAIMLVDFNVPMEVCHYYFFMLFCSAFSREVSGEMRL